MFVNQLSSEAVNEVEVLSNELVNNMKNVEPKKAIVKGVPRHAVLKPNHAPSRIINQQFKLCDRVVYVADHGKVNLASRGTVVGIAANNLIDVVMDEPFMSGTTLGGKCTQYRGATLPSYSVLNLSNPQFLASMDGIAENKTFESPQKPFVRQIGPKPTLGGDRYVQQATTTPQRQQYVPKGGYNAAHKGGNKPQQNWSSHQQQLASTLTGGDKPRFTNRPLPPHQQQHQPSFRPHFDNRAPPPHLVNQMNQRAPPPHLINQKAVPPHISHQKAAPPHLAGQKAVPPHLQQQSSIQFGNHSIPVTHAVDTNGNGNSRGGYRGRGRGRGNGRGRGGGFKQP